MVARACGSPALKSEGVENTVRATRSAGRNEGPDVEGDGSAMDLLRSLIRLPWLIVVSLFFRVRFACLRWRLRFQGIDVDSLPEIQELRGRHDEERRKLRELRRQLWADARSRSRQ